MRVYKLVFCALVKRSFEYRQGTQFTERWPKMAMDVYSLNQVFYTNGEYWENVLHFQDSTASSPTPEANAGALAQAYWTACGTQLMACMSTDTTFVGVKTRRINNTGGPTFIAPALTLSGIVSSGSTGAAGANCITPRLAAECLLDYYESHAVKPRWRNGKIYLGGVPETWYQQNAWLAAAAGYITFFGVLQGTIAGSFSGGSISATTCIWSKKYTTAYAGGNWELVPVISSLRRRIEPHL
jgi:hypothetical protein